MDFGIGFALLQVETLKLNGERPGRSMTVSIQQLLKCKMFADQGIKSGAFIDAFIDTENWTLQYLLFNCDTDVPGQHLLIHREGIKGVDISGKSITIATREQEIIQGPCVLPSNPLNRQIITSLLRSMHYLVLIDQHDKNLPEWLLSIIEKGLGPSNRLGPKLSSGRRLLSFRRLKDKPVRAVDGIAGHFSDLLLDQKSLDTVAMTIGVSKWLPGTREVMISPEKVSLNGEKRLQMSLELSRAQFENSPIYSAC